MSRSFIAVAAGLLLALALVYVADFALARLLPQVFDEHHFATLVGLLVYDVACLFVAGWTTGLLARRAEVAHALVAGALVLLAGIATVVEVHDGLPTWWHVALLLLAVPAVALGGSVRAFRNLPRED